MPTTNFGINIKSMCLSLRIIACYSLCACICLGCSGKNNTAQDPLGFVQADPATLVRPIEIVEGYFFLDGGSEGVHLRDIELKQLFLFVAWGEAGEDVYIANRMYLGIPPDARIVPESNEELSQIGQALRDALLHSTEINGTPKDPTDLSFNPQDSDGIAASKSILHYVEATLEQLNSGEPSTDE